MGAFTKFTSIESFAHVYRNQQRFETEKIVKVHYGAKIKLHGTNAAVRIDGDTVTAQSRSRDITPEQDNAGFAKWVHDNEDAWRFKSKTDIGPVIFYGEWAGKGIQKNDAVTKLDGKYFFIFAVQIGETMVTTPADIEEAIPDLDDVLVLPWDMIFTDVVDYSDPDLCQTFSDLLNEQVKRIGERDPFIYNIFGVDGPGEGWVISPICNPGDDPLEGTLDRYWYNTLAFKVKTEAHSVKKSKPASVKVEVPEGVDEFVDMFVTVPRCEQALTEGCDSVAAPERTGDFLKWIGGDIKKESVAELEDAGLEWKQVQKHVATAARRWFLNKCKEI